MLALALDEPVEVPAGLRDIEQSVKRQHQFLLGLPGYSASRGLKRAFVDF